MTYFDGGIGLNKDQLALLAMFGKRHNVRARTVACEFGISHKAAVARLRTLSKRGLVYAYFDPGLCEVDFNIWALTDNGKSLLPGVLVVTHVSA